MHLEAALRCLRCGTHTCINPNAAPPLAKRTQQSKTKRVVCLFIAVHFRSDLQHCGCVHGEVSLCARRPDFIQQRHNYYSATSGADFNYLNAAPGCYFNGITVAPVFLCAALLPLQLCLGIAVSFCAGRLAFWISWLIIQQVAKSNFGLLLDLRSLVTKLVWKIQRVDFKFDFTRLATWAA